MAHEVVVPVFPDHPGAPLVHGPFRLIPFGYVETPQAESTILGMDLPEDMSPYDDQLLRSAPFFIDLPPSSVPAGFDYEPPFVMGLFSGTRAPLRIGWMFPGSLSSRVVIERGLTHLPFDISVPPPDGTYEVVPTEFHGLPAVFSRHKLSAPNTIYFAEGDTLTLVTGDVPFDAVLAIAEEVFANSTLGQSPDHQ